MNLVKFRDLVEHSINKIVDYGYDLNFYKIVPNESEVYNVGHTKINFPNGLYFEFDSFIPEKDFTTFKKDCFTICTIDKKLKSFVVGVNSFGQVVVATHFNFKESI